MSAPEREDPTLADVAQRLTAAGRAQRATIAAARALGDAPGSELVGPTLRRLAAEDERPAVAPTPAADSRDVTRAAAHGGAPRQRLLRALPLVAAAALAGWLFLGRRGEVEPEPGPGPGDARLGGGALELVLPERLAGDAVLAWRDPRGRAARWSLRIQDPARAGGAALLVDRRGLEETRWVLVAEEVAGWPTRVLVEVEGFDASGASLGSVSRSLSR